ERAATSPFLMGRDLKPFSIHPSSRVVIIPYRHSLGRLQLIQLSEIQERTPKLYEYLLANREFLEARENGRMEIPNWHGFIYPKNIEIMAEPKILVPDIADRASFALDEFGEFAFASGYGIT